MIELLSTQLKILELGTCILLAEKEGEKRNPENKEMNCEMIDEACIACNGLMS